MRQEKKSRAEEKYGDIIDLPHYEPKNHERMESRKRAAQFAPFAALTGYGDAISEAARYTDSGMELSEDEWNQMDRTLISLQQNAGQAPMVRVVYFKPDRKKEGGSFEEIRGRIRKIDQILKCLIIQDGQKIPFKDIIDIEEV